MLAFKTQLCRSPLLSGSSLPPPSPPLLCVNKYNVYTRIQCVRDGRGIGLWASDRKHLAQSPFPFNIFRWRHFALPSMNFIFRREQVADSVLKTFLISVPSSVPTGMDQCFSSKIIRHEKINIYFAYSVFTATKMRPAKFFPILYVFYFVTMHSKWTACDDPSLLLRLLRYEAKFLVPDWGKYCSRQPYAMVDYIPSIRGWESASRWELNPGPTFQCRQIMAGRDDNPFP